jgi:hypothetical protein
MTGQIVSTPTIALSGTTPISFELGVISPFEPIVRVTLTAPLELLAPPGYPGRPPAGTAVVEGPGTYAAGAVLTLFDFEAQALITAGVAT